MNALRVGIVDVLVAAGAGLAADGLIDRTLLDRVTAVTVRADGCGIVARGHHAGVHTVLVVHVSGSVALAAGFIVLERVFAPAADRFPGRVLALGHVAMATGAANDLVHGLSELVSRDLQKHRFAILELLLQLPAVAFEALGIGVGGGLRSREGGRRRRQEGGGNQETYPCNACFHDVHPGVGLTTWLISQFDPRFFW